MPQVNFAEASIELLRSGYTIRFTATGQSMHPTIRDGEVIIVKPLTASDIKLSDVVLYHADRGMIAHRVLKLMKQPSTGISFKKSLSLLVRKKCIPNMVAV